LLALSGILIFAFLGIAQGLYGPLLPSFGKEFGVGTSAVGLLFAAQGLGEVIGVLLPTHVRVPVFERGWLAVACSCVVAGFVALLLSPTWSAVLASIFIVGFGFGIIVLRLNTLFARSFGLRSLTMLQILNAAFSVGTIIGPLIIGLFHPPIRMLYSVIAGLALLLVPIGLFAERKAAPVAPLHEASDSYRQSSSIGSRSHVLIGFILLMILVIGVEHSIAGWLSTLSLAAGWSATFGANVTAAFYALIFTGRLVAAVTGLKFDARLTVLTSIIGVAGCVAISLWPSAMPFGLALAGFAMAPFFSATLVWLGQVLATSRSANSLVIAGAIVGSAIFPPIVGRVIDGLGAGVAPAAILLTAILGLVACIFLRQVTALSTTNRRT
jgi:MFS transporter, FHS family, glucose/mannose:H+ symporter